MRTLPLALFVALIPACTSRESSSEALGTERAPIIGGVADAFRSYVVGVGDPDVAFCTGTLISRRTVLTAGHCFDTSADAGANGGISWVTFGDYIAGGKVHVLVEKVVRHPGFDRVTLENDLALVHLAADAPSQPVSLLRETLTNDADFIGPNFTFVGYGNDGASHYDLRRAVAFPILRVGPAQIGMEDGGSGPIGPSQFYYSVAHRDTCDGDSGGPGFVVRQGVERLAGSTSFGDLDCAIDGVDARTDTPAISGFIQPTIDAFEGTDPCRSNGVCDETCNVGNTLIDPDCAQAHCSADGMCVLSCSPVDPDCTGTDHCGPDGICDPSCVADTDCLPPGTVTSPDGSGGAGGSGTEGGDDDGGVADASTEINAAAGHCGCRVEGHADETPGLALLGIAALATAKRRRE